MKKDLENWLKECKIIRSKLLLKKTNFLTKDYERIVIDTQLKDIDIVIKKLQEILKKGV